MVEINSVVNETKGTKAKADETQQVKWSRVSLQTIKVKPDNESFLPLHNKGSFEFKVGLNTEELAIPPRMSFVIDGGMLLDLVDPVALHIVTDTEWAKKGLILMPNVIGTGQQRLSAVAYNVGKQILAFNVGDTIGSFSFVASQLVMLIPNTVNV